MARGFDTKPYHTKYGEAERFQKELKSLSSKTLNVIVPLLTEKTTEDQLHDMILCCYEILADGKPGFVKRAVALISKRQQEEKKKNNAIYNPYRNISFNQCLGESNMPVSDWLMLPEQSEWDDYVGAKE